MGRVEHLITQDQGIMSQVLRLANSVIFGGAVRVDNVRQAVMRLGFRETADIAIAAASRTLFAMEDRLELEVYPEMWRGLWHQSLVCAFGSRLIARELKRGAPERAFLGGMFHDVGALLILKVVSRGLVRGRLLSKPSGEELAEVIMVLHPSLGARYLEDCRMPDAVVRIAAQHEELDVPLRADTVDLHVVRVAEGFCALAGLAPFSEPGAMGPLAQESLEILEVPPGPRERFELQFVDLVEQVREFL